MYVKSGVFSGMDGLILVLLDTSGGTDVKKRRNVTHFSSHRQRWQVLSEACLRVPSERWMACAGIVAGDGSSF